ncbi:hypothetical protein GSY74_01300 [Sulfurovum sp. bin170]|uniref:hypothetical protein n=1 Tax=Sulfurovum sp. bin170 TaxID=2695268 RepID=UPI0013DFA403|nr:hypothetical protein [Sulfurovum sp. bin170]NEW59905.1 hypothetical protein [Sulfurovum sp. bin170]
MSTIKEYEAMYETFNKYAKEFQENPKTTKQIDPKFIKIEKGSLKKSIEEQEKKNLSELKNINKSNPIYDLAKNPKEQSDLKPKVEKLIESWNRVISKLENIKAPNKIQESAKSLKKDLIDHLKSLQKPKQKFDQERRNQVLEKLKQGKERNRGRER